MKIVARPVFALVLAAGLFAAAPAPAAPVSAMYTSFQQTLADLVAAETDPAQKTALEQSVALFDNTSKSFAADLTDGQNAIKKLEAAYGTSDANMTALLDGHVAVANVAALFRANQAFQGTQVKLLARGNLGAILRVVNVHNAQLKKYTKAFPAVADPSITRVDRKSVV